MRILAEALWRWAELLVEFLNLRKALRDKGTKQGIWIVNLSMEGPVPVERNAITSDPLSLLYVAAAGNEGNHDAPETYVFPRYDDATSEFLIVGALGQNGGARAYYSNFHEKKVDLFAIGSCVCGSVQPGSVPDPNPDQLNGTSQAAPAAAAAATILADSFPEWNAYQVKWRLISTTDMPDYLLTCDLGEDKPRFTECAVGGTLNLRRAVNNRLLLVTGTAKKHSSDVPIQAVKEHDHGWSLLLDSDQHHPVLRIHRVECSTGAPCPNKCTPGLLCFRRLRYFADPDYVTLADNGKERVKLEYQEADGQWAKIEAANLKELVRPIDWQ